MKRKKLLNVMSDKYGAHPDYLWERLPNYAALRHRDGKWFALIMDVSKSKLGLEGDSIVDVVNLKCDPNLAEELEARDSILPAYHMNKKHWISVVLESDTPDDELLDLIEQSYQLTKD